MRELKYLSFTDRFFIKRYPVEITFFVTSKCNFRCRHCFNWQNIEGPQIEEALTLDEIRKISKSMGPFLRLLISGGEPFLRDDLSEICKTFYENNKIRHLTLSTNGFYTSKILKITEEILKTCKKIFVNVTLSLDALYKKRDEICGIKKSFKKFEETYYQLRELNNRYQNLGVGVRTVHMNSNQEDI